MLRVSVLRLVMLLSFACAVAGSLAFPSPAQAAGIWDGSPVPAVIDSGDTEPIELGVRFSSDQNGYITGIRFYKSVRNTGTHIGSLWTASGSRIATGTFTNETASGWQQLNFSNPVAITANTTYVASYHTDTGHWSYTDNYFRVTGVDNPPLHAPINYVDGPNGLYSYATASVFPRTGYQSRNYWIDVIFNTSPGGDTSPPVVNLTNPPAGAANVYNRTDVTATFNEEVQASSVTGSTFILQDENGDEVPATVSYSLATRTATLVPASPLMTHATYTAIIKGGTSGVRDIYGNSLPNDYSWDFTTTLSPDQGPGGPILVISSTANPFSTYYAEILRAEGLNSFAVSDISKVTSTMLSSFDVVILGRMPLTSGQVSTLTNWVNSGGKLIAMRPDKQLATLLGLTGGTGTLDNQYIKINNTSGPGVGIVGETIQFHGEADLYTLNGAKAIANLYSSATSSTSNPAVTTRSIGSNGGQAAAFSYDLAQSVVYTRQGNPAWAGQNRDTADPWYTRIMAEDMFFGAATFDPRPNWIDFNKIPIPQADEQQRLLANMILQMNAEKPLPRFWYLPRGLKAAIIMTGDDHNGSGGTPGRFDRYIAVSRAGCSVEDWECVRSSSYTWANSALNDAAALRYHNMGFELGRHFDTGCVDWTPTTLAQYYSSQMLFFRNSYPSLPSPVSNRTHCVTWSDWATQPKVELSNGIRLDTTYYYYPSTWVQERPGMFTGSGFPMRFADIDGTMIDVYQAATQLTDESSTSYGLFNPAMVNTLLDNALGPLGYYGVFTANMHTDVVPSSGSETIITAAQARNVPIISSKQMLNWLDGRNGSYFDQLTWKGGLLTFSIVAGNGARNLVAMLPASSPSGDITSFTLDGSPVSYKNETIKGIKYVTFSASKGTYEVQYGEAPNNPPVAAGQAFSTPMNTARQVTLEASDEDGNPLTYSIVNVPAHGFLTGTGANLTYTPAPGYIGPDSFTFKANDGSDDSNIATVAITVSDPSRVYSLWNNTVIPGTVNSGDTKGIEVGMKFTADVDGYITGIRFYKSSGNTGTHIGNLWTTTGTNLARATFTGESASGWQQVSFATPVAINANTTYVASYYAPVGRYAADVSYFNYADDNPPLHALRNTSTNRNGVYTYSTSTTFPTSSWSATNYWVDVTFKEKSSVNTPPVAKDQAIGTTTNVAKGITLVAVDTESNPLTYVIVTQPAHGSLSGTPPALTYTPSSGYVGADGFTFKVNDGTFDSNIGAVTITVANIPPVATDQSITTSTGVAKTLTLSATDGDGNPLTYSVVTQPANGTLTGSGANLTYTPATGFNGSDSFTFKASDGLADSNTAKVSITVTTAEKPNSIWSNTATPALLDDGDGAPIELGVKFRSDFDGYITGIRFYKGIANNGIHIGNLWTSTGTLLASATFTNESSSGWQEVTFSTPVAIKANTTYVASYFTSSGHLSMTDAYFATTGVDNPPLHALRNGVDGANGLYRYTTSSAFPNSSYRSRNYWVDVLFKAATGVNIPPVAQNQSVTTAVETAKNITLTATDANGDGMTYAIVTYPSNGTISGTGANIVYTPTAGFSGVDNFTFRANDGTSNSNTATVTITVVASSQPVSIWNRAATPAIVDDGSSDPVELGMKFRSDLDGTVTGIRFYKSAANTGTHVGNLWSSTGVLLATATFRNETSTGWQEVSFSSPVAIRANTTYVASYFTQAGHLSYNDRYFATTGADAAPLHALRNGLDGGNGVYRYGTTSVFPNLSYNSRNYWVDVIFTPDGQ